MSDKTELEEYHEFVDSTSAQRGLEWAALGLAAEAGEVAGAIEKHLRKGSDDFDGLQQKVMDELGDVLWFAAEVCNELNLNLDEVLEHNIDKLRKRASLQ
jgi:NTP pyrophosphatase (non-canonical NTP hydrolase)